MKYLIASDIHGSLFFAKKLMERFEAEQADKMILLGDLYYHGPRNPLPQDYNPAEVAKLLNQLEDNITVVKGNCDSEVDAMISAFSFRPYASLKHGDKKIFFTHGHIINQKNPPIVAFDMLIYGHEHLAYIRKENGRIYANPGSVSLPKDGVNSYLMLCGDTLVLKDLDGEVLKSVSTDLIQEKFTK